MTRLVLYNYSIECQYPINHIAHKCWHNDYAEDLRHQSELDIYLTNGDINIEDIIERIRLTVLLCLHINWNKVHNKVKKLIDFIVITDEYAELIEYTDYKRTITRSVLQHYSLSEFRHGYAYAVYPLYGRGLTLHRSFKEAYQYGKILKEEFIIAKMSVNHVRSDYTNCDGMSDYGLDDYYVYDNYKLFDPSNPLDYYDYCMSIVAMELQFYTKDGIFTGGRWSNGSGKTFYDFMNPDRIKEMANVQYPIYYDPVEYAMYAD